MQSAASKKPTPAEISELCHKLIASADADPFAEVVSLLLRARAVLFRRGLATVDRVRAVRSLLVEAVNVVDRYFPPSKLAAAGGGEQ